MTARRGRHHDAQSRDRGMSGAPSGIPIHIAKVVATVDVLSDGRVIFGVGAGWNRQEMRNHGTDPKTRMRLPDRTGPGDDRDLDQTMRPSTTASSSTSTCCRPGPNPSKPRTRRSWSAEPAGLSRTGSSRSVTAGLP